MNTFYSEQVSNCDRRKLDMERIKRYLIKNGFNETSDLGSASHVFAVTCATTDANVADSVNLVHRLSSESAETAKVIVIGCLEKRHPKSLDDKVMLQVNPKEGLIPLQKALHLSGSPYDLPDLSLPSRNLMNVRVQDGCLGSCTYCKIRSSIGSAKSRRLQSILGDIDQNMTDEIEFIRLTGDDVGTYGLDIQSSLSELLESVSAVAPGMQLLIDNLDPKYMVMNWATIHDFAKRSSVTHIKIPVQHLNERILSLMRRFSDVREISGKVALLGQYGVQLQTHFIVGFPTETRDELFTAVDKAVSLPFGQISFIPYSNHFGSLSHGWEQVPRKEVKYRLQHIKEKVDSAGLVEVPYVDLQGIEEIKLVKEGYKNATRRYE
ncbi:radical SAM protein [Candidatus Woesearchaeota archaeon]|nr:radical SAM protein [Candidatus Woesearchaeota archaeon]